ncbi:MAG: CvpA family protein [Steroidobacteraceae bacterium]
MTGMNGADYLLLAILVLSVALGFVRGLLREVVLLAAWVLGLFLAWNFPDLVYPLLEGALTQPELKVWVARGALLTVTVLAGSLLAWILDQLLVGNAVLALPNRALGGAFGFLRAVLLCGFVVLVGEGVGLDRAPWWRGSSLLPYAQASASVIEMGAGVLSWRWAPDA